MTYVAVFLTCFSSENQFVVPPLGRKRLASRNGSASDACGLKAGLRTALFILSWRLDLHEGSLEMILSFRPVYQLLAPQRDHLTSDIYSSLSATIGSTFVARRAGR